MGKDKETISDNYIDIVIRISKVIGILILVCAALIIITHVYGL